MWFDSSGSAFIHEIEDWAIKNPDGTAMQGRYKGRPRQSLAGPYGENLREFSLWALKNYNLGGIMYDYHMYSEDFDKNHYTLANGWDSIDKQHRVIVELFDEVKQIRPDIFRFYCNSFSWPYILFHADHLHAGDPGMSGNMKKAAESDYPARALTFERKRAWNRHYTNFVPPWGIKGDIAGWSVQQQSPLAANPGHQDLVVGMGEGWTQNMFMCFATTCVRDIRFCFNQMPEYDLDILKKWLAWDRDKGKYIFNCRPVFENDTNPNKGVDAFSHVKNAKGVLYFINRSFDDTTIKFDLNNLNGFSLENPDIELMMVYPLKSRINDRNFRYGDSINIPIIGKDSVVI